MPLNEWTAVAVEQVWTSEETGATFIVQLNPSIDAITHDIDLASLMALLEAGANITIDEHSGKARIAGEAGGGASGVVSLTWLYHSPQNLASSTITRIAPGVFLPAGQLIGFDNPADSTENAHYTANGSGGITVGSKVAFAAGDSVEAASAFYDYTNLPSAWSDVAALVPHIEPTDLPASFLAEKLLAITLGGPVFLVPQNGPYQYMVSMQFYWGQDILDASSTADSPFRAWVQPLLYVANTHAADRYLRLGLHATLIRYCFIHNDGTHDLHITNTPSDGGAFTSTLGPGQRCCIWPNQGNWERWDLPPQFQSGDEGKVLTWDADGNLVSLPNSGLPNPADGSPGDPVVINPDGDGFITQSPQWATPYEVTFTGDGETKSFDLEEDPATFFSMTAFNFGTGDVLAFSIDDNSIVFYQAPGDGATIFMRGVR